MEKQNGVLFGCKKECSTDTCSNIDECQKHYAKGKKPGSKDHIVHDFVSMKCPEQGGPQRQKADQWLPRALCGGRVVEEYGEWLLMGVGFLNWD